MFQCADQTGPADTAVDEEQKTDSMEIDDSSPTSPAGDQRHQLAYVPTTTHTPATTYQENNDDGEDVPMDDDLAEEEKATDLRSKVNNHEKKNVKRVNWEKTEDTKKSHSHVRDSNNKHKTGFHEASKQHQHWRPNTNNSITQPAN
jgi:hypothetical protein